MQHNQFFLLFKVSHIKDDIEMNNFIISQMAYNRNDAEFAEYNERDVIIIKNYISEVKATVNYAFVSMPSLALKLLLIRYQNKA